MYPLAVNAQLNGDSTMVYEMTTENNIFVGARAAGMGGAQIAAGEDGSSVWYNPALLTRIRRMEISGALTHQRFFNQTIFDGAESNEAQLNKTRLSSFWAVFPVPTEQGGLSFAVAANRVNGFDRIFRFEDRTGWLQNPSGDGLGGGEDDLGSLWAYSLGGGIEVSRYVSVGLAIESYDGEDKYTYFDDEVYNNSLYSYQERLTDKYSGYSGKIGFAYSANSSFHFGATIKLPTYLTVEQEYFENDDYYPTNARYKYTLPFGFGAGVLYSYRRLLLAADINYTDYTQIEYRSGLKSVDALRARDSYKEVLAINLGAEYLFPAQGLTLRAGYCHDPIPYVYFPVDNDLDIITCGFSYLFDRSLKLDMALNLLSWSRSNPGFFTGTREDYHAQRIYVGFTYRM
jgi:long-subunit fatty acid transport protein